MQKNIIISTVFIVLITFFSPTFAEKKTKIETHAVEFQGKYGATLQASLYHKGWFRWKKFAHQNVTFYIDEKEIGKGTTNENGTVQYHLYDLTIGKHSWKCAFAGTSKYMACESNTISFEIKSDRPKIESLHPIEHTFHFGSQHLFYVRNNQNVAHLLFDGKQWTESEDIPGVQSSSPLTIIPFQEQLYLFYNDFKKNIKVVCLEDGVFTPAKSVFFEGSLLQSNSAPSISALDQLLILSYIEPVSQKLLTLYSHQWNEDGLHFIHQRELGTDISHPLQQAIASGGKDWGILVVGAKKEDKFFTVNLPLTEEGTLGEVSTPSSHNFKNLSPYQLFSGLDGAVHLFYKGINGQTFSSKFAYGEWTNPSFFEKLEEKELRNAPKVGAFFQLEKDTKEEKRNSIYYLLAGVTPQNELTHKLKKVGVADYEYVGMHNFPKQHLLGYIEGPPPLANENLRIKTNIKEEDTAKTLYEEEWVKGVVKGLKVSAGIMHGVGFVGTHAQMQAGIAYRKDWGEKAKLQQSLTNKLINYQKNQFMSARPVGMALLMRLQTDTYRLTLKDENGEPFHNKANQFLMIPRKVMIVARPYTIHKRGIPGELKSYLLSPDDEKELSQWTDIKLLNTWSIGGGLVQSHEKIVSSEREMDGYFSFQIGLRTGLPFIAETKHHLNGKISFKYRTKTKYTRRISTIVNMKGDGLTPGTYKSYDFYTYLLKKNNKWSKEFLQNLNAEDQHNIDFQNISPNSQPWVICYSVTNLVQVPKENSIHITRVEDLEKIDDLESAPSNNSHHRNSTKEQPMDSPSLATTKEIPPKTIEAARKALKMAEYYLQLKKFRESRPLLKEALALNPYLESTLIEKAKLAFKKGYYQATIEYCNILIAFKMNTNSMNTLLEKSKLNLRRLQGSQFLKMARRSLRKSNVKQAQSHLEAALAYDKALEEDVLKLAHDFYSKSKYPESMACCKVLEKTGNAKAKELLAASEQRILEKQILRDAIKKEMREY